MFIGIAAGFFLGLGVYLGYLPQEISSFSKWLGSVFLSLLKMIIIPLIFASIIVAVGGLNDIARLGKLGVTTMVYYFFTTALAVMVGLVLVNIVQPGVGAQLNLHEIPDKVSKGGDDSLLSLFARLILEAIPTNIIKSITEMDILAIIFFAIFFGYVLALVGKKGDAVRGFFEGLNEIMMRMTSIILRLAPYGVGAMVVPIIGEVGLEAIGTLLGYSMTVLLGLGVHAVITLPLLLFIFTKSSPFEYFRNMLPAISTAFGTASSSATLPVTIKCAEENGKVRSETASFVLPVGATINMDGTALYESIAVMFIAQAYGIELTLTQQLIVFITATLASVGAAGIPSAGLVMMGVVLNAVGLPLEGIGLILAVDRILDMFRTAINVWGDSIGARILDTINNPSRP
ncbi:MAG: dicarboxylate/amino acid:cation symporter [Nitrospinae bacterium]|nr:dicarboxylate/amino acid:cation symporter [Nitrospinota bacterium]